MKVVVARKNEGRLGEAGQSVQAAKVGFGCAARRRLTSKMVRLVWC
jgi:hypothetical protein